MKRICVLTSRDPRAAEINACALQLAREAYGPERVIVLDLAADLSVSEVLGTAEADHVLACGALDVEAAMVVGYALARGKTCLLFGGENTPIVSTIFHVFQAPDELKHALDLLAPMGREVLR